MKSFEDYLETTGEVGYASQIVHSVVQVEGLPQVKPREVVLFEAGAKGQVLSVGDEFAEVLPFVSEQVRVGERVARTDEHLTIQVGAGILGKSVDGLGVPLVGRIEGVTETRPVETEPVGLPERRAISEPLETGVSIVDLVVPLGRGQRELVIGDRKTGKSHFLLQAAETQIEAGGICVYCLLAKRKLDVELIGRFFSKSQMRPNTVLVVTLADEAPGAVLVAPFTAMTIAEYFKDQGKNVLVIFDDLTAHAKLYREVALLTRRFPGRNSYPGDIFYLHARLLERAGNFDKGSITALPVAESILGDLSGYIQTNIMAMTDGHLFFDADLANSGRRPALNPFLSVTRVGRQAQTPLVRDISRELSRFLTQQNRLRQFLHFGAELTEKVQRQLKLGDKLYAAFEISAGETMPVDMSVIVVGGLWAGWWEETDMSNLKTQISKLLTKYKQDTAFRQMVGALIGQNQTLTTLVAGLKQKGSLV